MKSIQSRLQSRISRRSTLITNVEMDRMIAKNMQDWTWLADINELLWELRHHQVLDKQILSKVYWNG